VMVGPGTGLSGFFWVSALQNITGSTTAQTFTATTSVRTSSTSQTLGICTFTLAQKGLSN
jgi:ribose 5-phosphate isomerase